MGRVAIVDDSKDAIDLFEVILSGDHEIVTYPNGELFMDAFRPGVFDLVLVDIVMPVLDGFTVLARIREQDRSVPVVAMTAQYVPSERMRALRAGFCEYFEKPIIEIQRFRDTVYSHVGQSANPFDQNCNFG